MEERSERRQGGRGFLYPLCAVRLRVLDFEINYTAGWVGVENHQKLLLFL